jgi:hypothetical protein
LLLATILAFTTAGGIAGLLLFQALCREPDVPSG